MTHINKLNINENFSELVHLNEGKKKTDLDNPCIYVANLGAYNAGKLVGKWLDLTTFNNDVDELQEAIDRIANYLGPVYGDEWAIHDYSNMPSSLGENPDLDLLLDVAQAVDVHGFNQVNAFCSLHDVADLSSFDDLYDGEWRSFQEFSDTLFDDVYLHEVPESIAPYIDYEKFAQDLGHDYHEVDNPAGGVFIFRSY